MVSMAVPGVGGELFAHNPARTNSMASAQPQIGLGDRRLQTQFFEIRASQVKLGDALKRDPDLDHRGIVKRLA